MRLATLFSGIDGFSLAGDWIGWETIFTCEIDKFCNIILSYYKPNIPHYGDIRKTDFTIWRGRVDVLAGGFPCQPYSVAGKRLGKEDDRHLWPEMLRAISECSPRWVVGENVRGIISWNGGMVFDEVQADLEALGYEVTPYVLPACAVNAPHRRDRTFFIAHLADTRTESLQSGGENRVHGLEITSDTPSEGYKKRQQHRGRENKAQIGTGVEFRNKRFGENGNAANTQCPGLERHYEWKGCTINRGNERLFAGAEDKFIISHPDSRRQSRKEYRKKEPGQFTKTGIPTDWRDFPTQPPVYYGDDGFPTELLRCRLRELSNGLLGEKEIDKIISKAVTKLRTESIKAGGNAVVPPLIYQIFKAINDHELKFNK